MSQGDNGIVHVVRVRHFSSQKLKEKTGKQVGKKQQQTTSLLMSSKVFKSCDQHLHRFPNEVGKRCITDKHLRKGFAVISNNDTTHGIKLEKEIVWLVFNFACVCMDLHHGVKVLSSLQGSLSSVLPLSSHRNQELSSARLLWHLRDTQG